MSRNVQFILGHNDQPEYAILKYQHYVELTEGRSAEQSPTMTSLLSEDGLQIRLPYGGPGAHIDLIRLVDFCLRRSLISIAINARPQALNKFAAHQMASLDPMLRICFLPKDSPYRNTMQATTEVVDALVETGLFIRNRRSFNEEYSTYYRPVNALDFVEERGRAFMQDKEKPADEIPLFFWAKSEFNKLL